MVRLVNDPKQKVYGNVPFKLPLYTMEAVERHALRNTIEQYDSGAPLDHDLFQQTLTDPNYYQSTMQMSFTNGMRGMGDPPLYNGTGYPDVPTEAQFEAQAGNAAFGFGCRKYDSAGVCTVDGYGNQIKYPTGATTDAPVALHALVHRPKPMPQMPWHNPKPPVAVNQQASGARNNGPVEQLQAKIKDANNSLQQYMAKRKSGTMAEKRRAGLIIPNIRSVIAQLNKDLQQMIKHGIPQTSATLDNSVLHAAMQGLSDDSSPAYWDEPLAQSIPDLGDSGELTEMKLHAIPAEFSAPAYQLSPSSMAQIELSNAGVLRAQAAAREAMVATTRNTKKQAEYKNMATEYLARADALDQKAQGMGDLFTEELDDPAYWNRTMEMEYSGMSGLGFGLGAATPAPATPQTVKLAVPEPIKPSTTYAVVGVSVLAVIGSIAAWAYFSGKKGR